MCLLPVSVLTVTVILAFGTSDENIDEQKRRLQHRPCEATGYVRDADIFMSGLPAHCKKFSLERTTLAQKHERLPVL